MKTYGQFCPIVRASEIIAERWTPIIVRNLLLGCRTFNEISAGAPGLSRALLSKRLHELERAGVIEIRAKSNGHGSTYELTRMGRSLWEVLSAMGDWAQEWIEVVPQHSDPDVVLWSWCNGFLRRDLLPEGRVVVRFEFAFRGRRFRMWMLVENGDVELCVKYPGFEEDLVVAIENAQTFARWHVGLVDWGAALRAGHIRISGPRELARELPTWNAGPYIHALQRGEVRGGEPGVKPLPHLDPIAEEERRRSSMPPLPPEGDPEIPDFEGWLVRPEDDGYDEVRRVWNGSIDRHPRYIARCRSASDAVAALRFARDRELQISVRGGGHGVAGTAVCDDGLVIDLSTMKRIQVDPASRTARAEGGVLGGELDAATQAFGLATTGGTVSHTGIAGLTLGGGIGWLMRRHGLSCDNLISAELITAEGERLTVSEQEHPDLFWGIRGGGGNFGVVTSFTYRLHPVGPQILSGPVFWDMEDAPEVLRFYREFIAQAPREVNTVVTLRRAPLVPFLPPELHRRPVCAIFFFYLGDTTSGEKSLEPMREFGRPLLDMMSFRPYTELQSMIDVAVQPGWHYYWKTARLGPLEDEVIDTLVEHSSRVRSPWSYMAIFQLGGAIADIDEDAAAYSNRDAAHNVNINGVWLPHEPLAEEETAWARRFYAALEPHQTGAYVNFFDRDDQDRVPSAYGEDKYRRLANLKHQYDPENVFRFNHNIRPLENQDSVASIPGQ